MPARTAAVSAVLMSLLVCPYALCAAPTRATLPAGELAFVALGDDALVTIWADGSVAVYGIANGANRSFFRLEHFNFRDTDFAVSAGPQPVLACLAAKGSDTECSFYDLQTGLCQVPTRLEKSAPIDTLGFSATGRSLFCASSEHNAIFRINTATRQVSRIGREGTKVFWPQYSADAKACVNFSADGSAVARNWKGEELWSLRGVYPLTGATLAPSPVLFLTDRAGRDVRAVRIADGKEVWRDGWMDGKHILAGSSDGRQLALWEGNQLQLVKLEGAKIKIGPAEKKTEACFSPNAKLLVYLPSLEIAGDDPQRLPVLKRANRLAQLVDCRTGQVIKRFALKPPAPASQSKPAVQENEKPPASVPTAEPRAARPKYRPARSKPAPAPAAAPAPRNSAFD